MITEAVAASDLHRDHTVVDAGDLAAERDRVIGVPRHTEPQPDGLDERGRPRTVGDVALNEPGVGQDVDEDVLGPLRLCLVPIVVDVLIVTGGDSGGDDEGGVAVERQLGKLDADVDGRRANEAGSQA